MAELLEIKAKGSLLRRPALVGRILQGLHEVLTGGRRAVMALHIEPDARHVGLVAEEGVQRPDHLRAFFIDRCGVKVVDRFIVVRPNRMGRGAPIFPELGVAKQGRRFHPHQGMAVEIGTETLVSENGETLFQGELKPVATSDAISRPVVEVFVGNHTLNPLQLPIRSRFIIGEN